MKKSLITLSCVTSLVLPIQAGEVLSAPKEVIPSCGWEWFAGGSVGYLTDIEEAMYTLHLGSEYVCDNHDCSHAIFLEVGYVDDDASTSIQDPNSTAPLLVDLDLDASIVPLTLNYKFEKGLTQNLNWYLGAGAGVAFVDFDVDSTIGDESFDDTTFYAQAFAGIVYNFSESFESFLGARYIYMDDPDLTGIDEFDNEISLDGDVLVELGLRYNF